MLSIYTKFVPVVAEKILIQNMAVDYIFFASPDVMLTSCVTGTNWMVSTGAVSCYPASRVRLI